MVKNYRQSFLMLEADDSMVCSCSHSAVIVVSSIVVSYSYSSGISRVAVTRLLPAVLGLERCCLVNAVGWATLSLSITARVSCPRYFFSMGLGFLSELLA